MCLLNYCKEEHASLYGSTTYGICSYCSYQITIIRIDEMKINNTLYLIEYPHRSYRRVRGRAHVRAEKQQRTIGTTGTTRNHF